jgi:chromosome segregation ATPase
MNRSLQRNEELIKKLQIDKQNLTNELTNIRDFNSTIENKKEQVIRQLTSKDIENEQLQAVISDMKIEIDMLRTQINNEKAVVKTLEELITSLRDKEFHIQIQAQERDSDLHLAKDRVNMGDLKM